MGNFTIPDLVVGDISEKSKYSEGRQLFWALGSKVQVLRQWQFTALNE